MDYNTLGSEEIINKIAAALTERHVEPLVVDTGAAALAAIKQLIPPGASVMNGASVTLEQIGYVDYLKAGGHGWNNLHEAILAEKDPAKQAELRKQSVLSDYYLGSVHALIENGQFIIASNSGSQLPHIVFTSPNIVFVVSAKKIVPTFAAAMERLEQHVIPLEEKRMQAKYGFGTAPNKILVFNGENPALGRKVRMILVKEDLGF